MKYAGVFLFLILFTSHHVLAEKIAVFPVVGVNTDQSFVDAFGMLLAKKYENLSGQTVINPIISRRAIGEDSSYITAAEKLGVSEYIEITAVGLYLSRTEKYSTYQQYQQDSTRNRTIVIIQKDDDNDDEDGYDPDDEEHNQYLLDNNKTIVTAIRKDRSGATIYKAELTCVVYGDIEEVSDRFARALYQKTTVEEVRSLSNVTRREGMGNNKLFTESIHGIKVGGYYPATDDVEMAGITAIGYILRMESRKFFIEFGVCGRFPSGMFDASARRYGGLGFEVGASYLFVDGVFSPYLGAGVIPHFNFLKEMEMGAAPYLQFGITLPRNSRTRFFVDFRVAQNVLPISTGNESENEYPYYYDDEDEPTFSVNRPCEIGLNIGVGW